MSKIFNPKIFLSTNSHRILVGKNSKENSYITHALAAESDIFFHVADFPGAHVVLQGLLPKPEDITDAAHLAVHFSQARRNRVKVDYTEIKYASRPKGSSSGLIELSKYKSLMIERDQKRIDSLLNKTLDPKK